MIVLRCTQRLLKESRIQPAPALPAPTAALGEWYATTVALPFRGRSLVLFVHGDSLLSVVAPGRVLGTTVPAFRERMPRLLHRLDLPRPWIAAHRAAISEIRFARTASRGVLGSMNEIAEQIRAEAEPAFSFDDLDLDRLEERLADVIFGALDYRFPRDVVSEFADQLSG